MIHLYLKQHRKTGLKYFGRTINNPFIYSGSGKYWKSHCKKHGDFIDTTHVWSFKTQKECSDFAIKFSKKHNIVESKEWANLIREDGLNSFPAMAYSRKGQGKGRKLSKKHKNAISIGHLNSSYCHSEETKKKISDARSKIKSRPHSEKTRNKIGNNQPKHIVTCPNCGKSGKYTGMRRWHFDNCKF